LRRCGRTGAGGAGAGGSGAFMSFGLYERMLSAFPVGCQTRNRQREIEEPQNGRSALREIHTAARLDASPHLLETGGWGHLPREPKGGANRPGEPRDGDAGAARRDASPHLWETDGWEDDRIGFRPREPKGGANRPGEPRDGDAGAARRDASPHLWETDGWEDDRIGFRPREPKGGANRPR
jgi:hypothetical protein